MLNRNKDGRIILPDGRALAKKGDAVRYNGASAVDAYKASQVFKTGDIVYVDTVSVGVHMSVYSFVLIEGVFNTMLFTGPITPVEEWTVPKDIPAVMPIPEHYVPLAKLVSKRLGVLEWEKRSGAGKMLCYDIAKDVVEAIYADLRDDQRRAVDLCLTESMVNPQSEHPWDKGYRSGAASCWRKLRLMFGME